MGMIARSIFHKALLATFASSDDKPSTSLSNFSFSQSGEAAVVEVKDAAVGECERVGEPAMMIG